MDPRERRTDINMEDTHEGSDGVSEETDSLPPQPEGVQDDGSPIEPYDDESGDGGGGLDG